jgi:hypothetical protein
MHEVRGGTGGVLSRLPHKLPQQLVTTRYTLLRPQSLPKLVEQDDDLGLLLLPQGDFHPRQQGAVLSLCPFLTEQYLVGLAAFEIEF